MDISRDGFVWLLGSFCFLHLIPFDAHLLLQRRSPMGHGCRLSEFHQATDELDLKPRESNVEGLAGIGSPRQPLLIIIKAPVNTDFPFLETHP